MVQTIMNGIHRPEHKVGKRKVVAGLAMTAPLTLKAVEGGRCAVSIRSRLVTLHPYPYFDPNPYS
jgi:hypothetical protein